MCSLAPVDQNRLSMPCEPSIESSFSLLEKEDFSDSPFFLPLRATIPPYFASFSEREEGGYECPASTTLAQKNGMQGPPFPDERGDALAQNKEIVEQNEKVVAEISLELYKGYLKKRISKTSSKPVSTRQLFKEITAQGYRGTVEAMKIFLSMVRKNQGKVPEACLHFHKDYLKKRVTETSLPPASVKQLFQEIKVKGYRGSFSGVSSFISTLRSKKNRPSEASFQFHKEYIKKRLQKGASESVSTRQLFEEIQANGYAGAYNTVKAFVSIVLEKKKPEASLQFHKEYIQKKVEKTASETVSIRKLFEEIQATGYLGSYDAVRAFVSTIREKQNKRPEASLQFHREYIKKRLEEAVSESVSSKQLFEEIRAKGYQGNLRVMQTFVSMIRMGKSPKASLAFHKEYIRKRLTEAALEYVSATQIFEEIRANGYLGAYNTVKVFVSMIRTISAPEASLQFHKDYITKRLRAAAPNSVSIRQIFEEIKASGYLGSYDAVRAFVSTIRKKKNKGAEASFQFHKEYLKKRLEEAASESVSIKELFEEIKAKGYQGTLRTVQTFVSMIRTIRPPEASLQFHKDYIKKRLRGAASESVSPSQLFEEIIVRGYRGTLRTVQTFVSMILRGVASVYSL